MCILGHKYKITNKGIGGYHYCGIVTATNIPMLVLHCVRCGNKKVVEA